MLRDIRLAFRMLRSWRFGAAAAVLTLAIGIGTASSMYALVRMALASTMPDVEDLPSLARIYASSRSLGVERAQLRLKDADLLASSASFESVGAYSSDESEMTVGGEPLTISLGEVSDGFFPALRARAAAGRLPSRDEMRQGSPVAVVSDAIWRKHFVGRSLDNAVVTIDGIPRTVVGVLPPRFGFSFIGIGAEVWVPMPRTAEAREHRVAILARLKSHVTWTAASAELDALARPQNPNGLWTWSAITVEQDVKKRRVGGLGLMFGPALIVLLIGCTNVACMLLARGIDRDVELSVRSALGASRPRIIRQLLAENLALGALGGVLGVGLSYVLLRAIVAAIAQFHPEAALMAPVSALFSTAFFFSLGACVLFGTVPAIRLSRRDIVSSLKGGTSPAAARFVGYRARDLVVFVELGAAVALVLTTAMFIRLFAEIQSVRPLFAAGEVVRVDDPGADTLAATARIAAVPGVRTVAIATASPGSERGSRIAIVRAAAGRTSRAAFLDVDSHFFETVGLRLLRGRGFEDNETLAHAHVAIVSEAAVERLWPGGDPIGQMLSTTNGSGTSTFTIVGVAGDSLDAEGMRRGGLLSPEIYLPVEADQLSDAVILARVSGNPLHLLKPIAQAVRPGKPARAPHVRVAWGEEMARPDSTYILNLFAGFGVIAMLLAASGIFGVISQSVAQRTTEFGVRMAMGASAGQVLRMVLAREAKLIGVSAATGLVGTVLVTRSAFYEMLVITGSDPRMWIAVAALCGGLAAAAVALATCRIVRLDPWVVLRRS